jgi:hypothetical protein
LRQSWLVEIPQMKSASPWPLLRQGLVAVASSCLQTNPLILLQKNWLLLLSDTAFRLPLVLPLDL